MFDFSWQSLYPNAHRALRAVLILVLAGVASMVVSRLVRRLRVQIAEIIESRSEERREATEKRAATIGGVIRKTAVVLIWTVAALMALREAGYDVGPLLAGAGIAGVAIGFGAQSLVRDVIAGMFLVVENQIRVGDVAKINGTGGLVEEVNLRTTVLRDLEGIVHIFPNGTIQTLANLTRSYSCYVFDIGVAYKEDTDAVMAAMRAVDEEIRKDPEFSPSILEPLEIFGVDQFADSAVIVKGRIKCRPARQWTVGREYNRRFKKKFDELGIEIPFPHLSLYMGEASKPLRFEVSDREELKSAIREVLAERERGSVDDA